MTNKIKYIFFISGILIFGYSLAGAIHFLPHWFSNPKLIFQIERPFTDVNFRDLGSSLNECMQSPSRIQFNRDKIYRAARFFSGWSCDYIGNPRTIITLNYRPDRDHEFFCYDQENNPVTGLHANTSFQLDSIEDLRNWKDPRFKRTVCQSFRDAYQTISKDETLLVHCDAGRDRTGAMAAMLAKSFADSLLTDYDVDSLNNAIECDYRKSKSLVNLKYGKMTTLLRELDHRGGVNEFLAEQCEISPQLVAAGAKYFIYIANLNAEGSAH